MKYDEFISQVCKRAGIDSREVAERTVAATLETLGQRLTGGEPKDLAAQLPPELAMYLQKPDTGSGEDFSLDEFFWRIGQREGVDLSEATFHARVVIGLLSETVTMGEIQNVQAQLPNDFAKLFDVQNEGSLPVVDSLPESVDTTDSSE
jgi:uncharacterized protein (DUF2267 family)